MPLSRRARLRSWTRMNTWSGDASLTAVANGVRLFRRAEHELTEPSFPTLVVSTPDYDGDDPVLR